MATNFIASPSTPNSYVPAAPTAPAAYLTPAQFLLYYDARTVGDLVSDSGTRVPAGSLASNAILLQLLSVASGMVEAACLLAGRYQPGDLAVIAGLTPASNGVSMNYTPAQGFLFQLVADLTIGLLIRRRPDKRIPMPAQFVDALNWLEQLRQGERIFGLVEIQTAGNLNVYQELASDVQARDLVVTQARRFFGRRVDQSESFPSSGGSTGGSFSGTTGGGGGGGGGGNWTGTVGG